MRILSRKKAKPLSPGFLEAEVGWTIEDGRVYIAADDLIKSISTMKTLAYSNEVYFQIENIENALRGFQIKAGI